MILTTQSIKAAQQLKDLLPIIVNTCSVLKQLQINMFGSLMS